MWLISKSTTYWSTKGSIRFFSGNRNRVFGVLQPLPQAIGKQKNPSLLTLRSTRPPVHERVTFRSSLPFLRFWLTHLFLVLDIRPICPLLVFQLGDIVTNLLIDLPLIMRNSFQMHKEKMDYVILHEVATLPPSSLGSPLNLPSSLVGLQRRFETGLLWLDVSCPPILFTFVNFCFFSIFFFGFGF